MKKSKPRPKKPIKLRKRTEELLNKNPSVIKKIPPMDVRNLLEDLQIYQIELEKYNNELQKVYKKLQDGEERYRTVVESQTEMICRFIPDGTLTFVNEAYCRYFDKDREELIGHKFMPLISESDRDKVFENIASLNQNTPVITHEHRVLAPNGKICWHKWTNRAIYDDKSNLVEYQAVGWDITNRVRIEEALRESEEKYRLLSEGTFEAVVWHDKGKIIEANEQYYEMFGYKPEDLAGKDAIVLTATPDSVKFMREQISLGHLGPYEVVGMKKDGTEFPMGIRVKIMEYNGKMARMAAIRDLTDRKQAEEALRESEERYRSLAENSLVGFWHITLEGHTIYINPAMCSMIEIESTEELADQTYHSFFTSESLEMIEHERTERPEGRGSCYEAEIIGKNGRRRNVMICGAPLLSAEDKLHGYIATFTDITDRKRAEEKLREAHDELEHRVKERTRELEIKTDSLEEINTAMKVLLNKREEDKTELENNVLTNVKELIVPYFDKIQKTKLDDQQEAFLSIIESNLNEIVSPFTRKMSLKYLNLTPTEIQIANLIRHGNHTKKIAELLNVSPRTVETHRKNIRRKIGLERKKANLRSHLLSLH